MAMDMKLERIIKLVSDIDRKLKYIESERKTNDSMSNYLIDQEKDICRNFINRISDVIEEFDNKSKTIVAHNNRIEEDINTLNELIHSLKKEINRLSYEVESS